MSMSNNFNQISYKSDRIKKIEKRLEKSPYDIEAWGIILRDAANKKIEDARPQYEKLVTQFPSSGRYWKLYIEHEMKSRNYERVEKLFTRCLVRVLNIDLWRTYLSYVDSKRSLPSYREIMVKTYDFALDKVGMDILSYPIWNDYIKFLKNAEAVGSYAENRKITAVRKVYQRGVVNPMTNIDQLWKDYVSYEKGINDILADKLIQDRKRNYMNARRVAKQYEALTRGLNRNLLSTPPQGLPEEVKQVNLWEKYITWEKSNPLKTDHATLKKRVMFVYEQCLLCLGHHPNIWHDAALFLEQSSKIIPGKDDVNAGKLFSEAAATMYERATTSLLKNNMLLYFSYADFEEGRMNYDKVHQIYTKLIGLTDIDPTLAYILYMKFTRRSEGTKSARTIFKRAREDPKTKHHVYVAAAWMEYDCGKDSTISSKIFELGLKKFGDNPVYILAYIDYLSHLNDDNNTRALFERILTSGSLPTDKSVEIWNRFLEFESNIGDRSSILKVEKRRADAFSHLKGFKGKETALLVDRYKFLDLYPCPVSELKLVGDKEFAKQHATGLPSTIMGMKNSSLDYRKGKPAYAMPDTNHMIPFKPQLKYPTKAHLLPGGVFPPPPAASQLMKILPPPVCFHGPFVVVDELIQGFNRWKVPDPPIRPLENGVLIGSKKSLKPVLDAFSGKKRKFDLTVQDESQDRILAPPSNDVYRARQQKRMKTFARY